MASLQALPPLDRMYLLSTCVGLVVYGKASITSALFDTVLPRSMPGIKYTSPLLLCRMIIMSDGFTTVP